MDSACQELTNVQSNVLIWCQPLIKMRAADSFEYFFTDYLTKTHLNCPHQLCSFILLAVLMVLSYFINAGLYFPCFNFLNLRNSALNLFIWLIFHWHNTCTYLWGAVLQFDACR
jgi:hypothetical protein